jgi:hypothetical protein
LYNFGITLYFFNPINSIGGTADFLSDSDGLFVFSDGLHDFDFSFDASVDILSYVIGFCNPYPPVHLTCSAQTAIHRGNVLDRPVIS